MSTAPLPPATAGPGVKGLAVVVLAVLAVAVATVVGVRGLLANPVRSVAPDGTATISGSFEPVECDTACQADCRGACAQGFVQAGARSAFVRFPGGCPAPGREQQVTVTGRPAPDLGKNAFRATACA